MTNGWAIKNEHKIAIPLGFLYKIPSIIDNISYTLVSLIMHYFDSWIVYIMSVMFLIPTQEFGDTLMMTISPKLVI